MTDVQVLAAFAVLRVPLAFALDAALGEPAFLARAHPVVLIGRLVQFLEARVRARFPATARGEFWGGTLLVASVCAVAAGIPLVALGSLVFFFHATRARAFLFAALALDVFWGYQSLAARALCDEALNVRRVLARSLAAGRHAVARIVGRDTDSLDEANVVRACVETVAENLTDGVVSPLIAYALGGAPFALLYKAVNTMDSMLGYKNARYRHFGTAAARLDDAANFLGARISAALLLIAAALFRAAGRHEFHPVWGARMFRRDRAKHESPNAAQTESAAAGILGITLGGGAFYAGTWEARPALGDATRPPERADITRTAALMYAAAAILTAVWTAVGWVVLRAAG